MINQLLDLFLKNGLRPLSMLPEVTVLEKAVTRSELATLIMLHVHGEMTMSELASTLGAPLSTMTSLTKRLDRKGLICRCQSDKDQRIILVKLTDAGTQLVMRGWTVLQTALIRVQSALSADELNQFVSLAIKVGKALQEAEHPDAASGGPDSGKAPAARKISIDD